MRFASKFILVALLAIPAFAQSLRIALITTQTPQPNCEIPSFDNTFPIDTPNLYVWFRVDGVIAGDRYRVQWVMPDGWVHSTVNWEPSAAGSRCFSVGWEPAKAALANRTGSWFAIIIRNDTQTMGTADFRFTPASGGSRLPAISAGGIAEPWTYQRGLSPGGWATLYGSNLAAGEASWKTAPGELLPTILNGVSVRVDGVSAPIAYVSPGVINFLAPGSLGAGDVQVTVESNGAHSPPATVPVRQMKPAIYSIADVSRTPAAFFVTGARAGLSELVGNPAIDPRALRGALPGESIDLYVTGLGRTSSGFPTDRMFAGSYPVLEPVTVELKGVPIAPNFAGLISPGLYLVRFTVPQNAVPGDQEIFIKSGDHSSAANVFLRIEDPAPPVVLEGLTLSVPTVVAGNPVSGAIRLSGPAPAGGAGVQLSIDSGTPSTITVEANRNSTGFTYTPRADSPARVATVYARWKGMEKSAVLTITAPPQSPVIQTHEMTLHGTATIEGKRVTLKVLLSVPHVIPSAQVDTFDDSISSGILLFAYYTGPAVNGNSVTFSSVNGLGNYSNIFGGVYSQTISGGTLTLTVPAAAAGTPVSGTIQFRTASKNISAQFTGSVISSTKVR